jgi:hypothetical protein
LAEPSRVNHVVLACTLVLTGLGLLFTGSTVGAVLGLGLLGLSLSIRVPVKSAPEFANRTYFVVAIRAAFLFVVGLPVLALTWMVIGILWLVRKFAEAFVWWLVLLIVVLPLLAICIRSAIGALVLWVLSGLFTILSWLFRTIGLGKWFASLRRVSSNASGRLADVAMWLTEKPSAIGHRWLRTLRLEPRLTQDTG